MRTRVLLAPVTVTPTKPLTPSHLKFLLWIDVLYRATALIADVTYRFSHTAYHPTEQTLGFWAYLDRVHGDAGYRDRSEVEIGEIYMAFRAEQATADRHDLAAYADAAERGWVHPASTRILSIWTEQYARLGMHDPGLLTHQPPGFSLAEVLARLADAGQLLDLRRLGGPVFLDLTARGLPLRQLVTADGRPNYLACALRDLLPLAAAYDEIVLARDPELDADYQLLHHVLAGLGPRVRRLSIGRVPIGGVLRSARHGDWRGHDARSLLATATAEHDLPAVRLGLRLYFITRLGPGADQSFRPDLLHQCLARAARLWTSTGPDAGDLAGLVAPHRGDHAFVDPYRLTAARFGRRSAPPARDLLTGVYV